MNHPRIPWLLVIAALAGLGVGLAISWILLPPSSENATPATLRSDFKGQYRILVASAYQETGDLPRAQSRLGLLGDPDPAKTLVAQAQDLMNGSGPSETVRALAALAEALNGSAVVIVRQPAVATGAVPLETATPGGSAPAPIAIAETPSPQPETGSAAPGPAPTEFETPLVTSVVRATRQPTPTPGAPFALVSADTLCDPGLQPHLLQVIVRDRTGRPVPGVEIVINWNGGEDHFFTGLKPELGNGYADFLMDPGVVYALRLSDASTNIPDVAAPSCAGDSPDDPSGVLRLIFQQP